jgi:hypothetical protein
MDNCLRKNVTYEENGLRYTEIIKQKQEQHCTISAGFVDGENRFEGGTVYVKVEKENVLPVVLFLKPDEAQSVIWALSGVLWSYLSCATDAKGDD